MADRSLITSRRASLALALVVGVVAAVGAVAWLHHSRADAAAVVDQLSELRSDRLDSTTAGLLDDGVVVTDDGRYLLDEADEETLVDAVGAPAAGSTRVFVVLWAPGQELGAYDNDIIDELVARLGDAIAPQRGVLLVWQGPEDGYVETLGGRGFLADFSSGRDFVGDPAVTLPKAIAAAADVDWYDSYSDSDEWGGPAGGGFLGLLIALLIVFVLRSGSYLLRLVGGPRLPGSWRKKEER